MSKARNFMSFRVADFTTNLYREPLSGVGIGLGEALSLGVPDFLVHECGFLPQGDRNWNLDGICSPFWRLYHNLKEGHWIEWDGGRLEITSRNIVLVPSGVPFDAREQWRVPQLWLHFSLLPAHAFEPALPFALDVNAATRAHITCILERHPARLLSPGPQSTSHMVGMIRPDSDTLRVLHHHAIALLHAVFAGRRLPLRPLPQELRGLLHEIEAAPGEEFANSALARRTGMSTSTFIRWFQTYMNETPAAYVRRVRLDRASRMLVFSDASLEQIASELGFSNRHYFSRAFVKYAGCGPATFRKNHRAPQL